MAERALFSFRRGAPTAEQRTREHQQRRRNLRIAIRQLERAELYVAGLVSLNLDDREAESAIDDLKARIHALQRYLVELRIST